MKTFVLIHGSWHGAWNWHKEATSHSPFFSKPVELCEIFEEIALT